MSVALRAAACRALCGDASITDGVAGPVARLGVASVINRGLAMPNFGATCAVWVISDRPPPIGFCNGALCIGRVHEGKPC